MNHIAAVSAVSLIALSAAMPQDLYAQEIDNNGAPQQTSSAHLGNDIVVTARRREERSQDVPISIVAFSGEQAEERGVTKITDIQNIAAGFKAEPQNSRPSTLQLTIRGQRMYGVLAAQDSPTAFYFADALIVPTAGVNTALHDLANIQVLKGPQGTLFGRNTTGGALVITPARPDDELSAELTATYGNYDTIGLKGFVNVPVSDNFQLRIAGLFQKHDGYQYNVTPGFEDIEVNDDNAKDLRLSAIWKPTDTIENYFVGYVNRNHNGANVARIVAINPNGAVAATYAPEILDDIYEDGDDFSEARTPFRQFEKVRAWGVVNTTSIELGSNLNLKNIFSYRNVKVQTLFDTAGSNFPVVVADSRDFVDVYTEELQLHGTSFDDRLTWVVGGYYMHQKQTNFNLASVFNPTFAGNKVSPVLADMTNKSLAGYAQGTYELTNRLQLTAGVRLTKDTREIVWRSRTFFAESLVELGLPNLGLPGVQVCALRDANGDILPIDMCNIAAKKSFTEPTWTISLDYHITPDVLLYATQRRGYRSGGWNQRAVVAAQRLPFDAETVTDYEIGAKTDFSLADWNVRLNVAAYYDKCPPSAPMAQI